MAWRVTKMNQQEMNRHGASRLLAVFAVLLGKDLQKVRDAKDPNASFASYVAHAARQNLRQSLPAYMVLCAEKEDDPGANPPGRTISFTADCRVGQGGAERLALGDRADWVRLKQGLRQGIQDAAGWVLQPRAANAEAFGWVDIDTNHLTHFHDRHCSMVGQFLTGYLQQCGLEAEDVPKVAAAFLGAKYCMWAASVAVAVRYRPLRRVFLSRREALLGGMTKLLNLNSKGLALGLAEGTILFKFTVPIHMPLMLFAIVRLHRRAYSAAPVPEASVEQAGSIAEAIDGARSNLQSTRTAAKDASSLAMAALAAECVATMDGPSIVVDPTCGMGTLLLAAARVWPQVSGRPLRLVGREMNPSQLQKCYSNFSSCHLDMSDVQLKDGRDPKSFTELPDASAIASTWEIVTRSYSSFLRLAERIVRPGGRCVLLSERKEMLTRRISSSSWQTVASWVIGRGEGNTLEFLLIALERRDWSLADALVDAADLTELDSDQFNAPLHWAAWNGKEELVEELLRRGAPLRQPNAEGLQAVHLAVRNGQLSALAALWSPIPQATPIWLPQDLRSADALSVDTKGRLPLHWAALHGRGALLASVHSEGSLGGLVALRSKATGWACAVSFACLARGHGGTQKAVRTAVADAPASADLAPPVDLRQSPWEALHEAFQAEARRCWGPGFDGKECLSPEHPAKAEEPPFRRRWLKRREEDRREAADPYETLGVSRNSTLQEIRRAYIRLAKETHPDTGGDGEVFQDVLLAYRILSDEERRKAFDDTGEDDAAAEVENERKVRLPGLEILRPAVENHRELYWERDMERLAGQLGTVQCDDPETGMTEVVIWVSDEEGYAAWLPTEVLTYVILGARKIAAARNPDGEEQPYEFYQRALVRLNKGALFKPESFEKQSARTIQYTLGWAGVDNGPMMKPDPLRDAAFAQECEDEQIGPEQGLFLLRGDAQELPFRDQQIDYVWWSFGWEEVERPEEVLKGIYRILKVGGRVAIATSLGKPQAKERSCTEFPDCVARGVFWEHPFQRPGHFIRGLSALPWHSAQRFELCRRLESSYEHIKTELLGLLNWTSVGQRAEHDGALIAAGDWQEVVLLGDAEDALPNRQRCPATSRWRKKACVICGHLRQERCKHCRHCARCVRRFDHHCPWLGNCIGEQNLFLASTLLSLLLALQLHWEALQTLQAGFRAWLVTAILFIDSFLAIFVTCVLLQQAGLAVAGITRYEGLKAKDFRSWWSTWRFAQARRGSETHHRSSNGP
eukprot:g15563.t1